VINDPDELERQSAAEANPARAGAGGGGGVFRKMPPLHPGNRPTTLDALDHTMLNMPLRAESSASNSQGFRVL